MRSVHWNSRACDWPDTSREWPKVSGATGGLQSRLKQWWPVGNSSRDLHKTCRLLLQKAKKMSGKAYWNTWALFVVNLKCARWHELNWLIPNATTSHLWGCAYLCKPHHLSCLIWLHLSKTSFCWGLVHINGGESFGMNLHLIFFFLMINKTSHLNRGV